MRPPRWASWALVGLLACAVFLVLRPVASDPLGLAIGAARTEAPRHFWGLWATAEHLGEWGPFVAHLDLDYPSGYTRHLMDPVNLLPFLPVWWALGGGITGAVAGYNAVHVFWAVLAGVGGWLLARRLVGGGEADREMAALVAAFACATAPYLLATPYLGRTELLPGAAYPLHLYLLLRALDERARWWELAGAGLSLAAVALGGWYLAAWLLLLEPVLALAFLRGRWRAWPRLVVIAVVAVLPVLPALRALYAWPPPILGEEQRVSVHMGICTPPWLLLPFTGNQGLPGTDLPAYPGVVLFLLAAAGGVLRRQARGWLALALVLLVFSLGPFLVWSNDASALQQDPARLPAWWLEKLLPPLRFIWGWCRLGILVTWPLALSAAWGVAAILPRLRAVRVQAVAVVLALLAVDHAHDRAPAGVEGHAFDARPPAGLLEGLDALGPGAVIQLPLDDFYMTWQLAHGRPIAESLEIEDARSHYLVQKATALLEARRDGAEAPFAIDDPTVLACISDNAHALAAAGWAGVVIHRDRLPDAHLELSRLLTRALGAPVHDGPLVGVWALRGQAAPPGLACPVETVVPVVPGGPEPG